MMLKDLRLAQEAAKAAGAKTQLGAAAARIYSAYAEGGEAASDFSGLTRVVPSQTARGLPGSPTPTCMARF